MPESSHNNPPTAGPEIPPTEGLIPESMVERRTVLVGIGAMVATAGAFAATGPVVELLIPAPAANNTGHEVKLTNEEHQTLEDLLRQNFGQDTQTQIREAVGTAEKGEGHDQKHGPSIIDWLGTANFARGIQKLIAEEHIDQGDYTRLGVLIALKLADYKRAGNTEGAEHIKQEITTTAKFTIVLEGLITAAEGIRFDVEGIYKRIRQQEMHLSDRVAITTSLAACLGGMVTTVGNAGIKSEQMKKIVAEADQLADQMINEVVDHVLARVLARQNVTPEMREDLRNRLKANLQGEICNAAGLWGVGDPPFLATLERFGIKGFIWQTLQVGLTPAINSLFGANYRIQKTILEMQGFTGKGLAKQAAREAFGSMWRNKDIVATIMGRSAENVVRAASPLSQHKDGLQYDIVRAFGDKARGILDLIAKDRLYDTDPHGSLVEEHAGHEKLIATLLADAARDSDREQAKQSYTRPDTRHAIEEINGYVDQGDFAGLAAMLRRNGLSSDIAEALARGTKLVQEAHNKEMGAGNGLKHKWNPLAVYRRITSVDRQQAALGHSATDVLNIFPFQSLSTIFALPVLQYATTKLDQAVQKIPVSSAIQDSIKRGVLYSAVGGSSMTMDNLVAVRMGYDIMPDDPAHPLLASMYFGEMWGPANLANVAGYPLQYFGMDSAIRQWKSHMYDITTGLVWAEALSLADRMGVPGFKHPTRINAEPTH